MRFQGFRIPEGMIADMNYINHETGMSKSEMVRQGLMLVINDFFQKEKVKNDQIQKRQINQASMRGNRSEDFMSLPDGW